MTARGMSMASAIFARHYGETFTDADLWRSNIPTFEEYGEWSSVQAHAFALRLLAPAGTKTFSNYLRAFTIDSDILRALGVRFVLTDADTLEGPATLRGSVTSPGAPSVYLFEFGNVNLGTYSPTHFVKAATANEIVERIRENKNRLDRVAVVSDDVPSTTAQARNVMMTIERDGIRVRAESDGPAHIVLPVQFSNCLVVVNGAAVRLSPSQSLPDTDDIRRHGRRQDRISLRTFRQQSVPPSGRRRQQGTWVMIEFARRRLV